MKKRKNVDGAKRHFRKNGTTLQPDAIFHIGVVSRRSPLLEKMAPRYNLASFSSKSSPFYFETSRTHGIHIFLLFPSYHWIFYLVFNASTWYTTQENMGSDFVVGERGFFQGKAPWWGALLQPLTLRLATTSIFVIFSTIF